MKKDIDIPEVKDVYVAAFEETLKSGEKEWRIALINNTSSPLENVMINSRGYSDMTAKSGTKTSTIRRMYKVISAKSAVVIEPIMPEVFHLFNEYWVTFFEEGIMKDRQFIFGPYTIDPAIKDALPVLGKTGVLVR